MIKSIVRTVMVALIFPVSAANAAPTIVEGGVIHFRGEIVEQANYDVIKDEVIESKGMVSFTSRVPVMDGDVQIGELVTVNWE